MPSDPDASRLMVEIRDRRYLGDRLVCRDACPALDGGSAVAGCPAPST
jgi:hypothetical protein